MRIDVGGYRLHATRSGPTEPRHSLVFLHGLAGTGDDWAHVSAALDGHERLLLDLLGHGRSDTPDEHRFGFEDVADGLARVADALGRQRPVWVGYSFGARLLLHLALRRPERVGGLVLESVHTGIEDAQETARRADEDEGLAQILETRGVEAFLEVWHRKPAFDARRRDPQAWRAEVTKKQSTNRPEGLARCLRHLGLGSQRPLLPQTPSLAVPVLLVAGALDRAYADQARLLAGAVPKARLALVPDAGHNVHGERPAAFVNHLNDYLSGLAVDTTLPVPR